MSSINNPGNFLRTSRNFPTDPQALSVELSKTYIDIASQVNDRISGIHGINTPIITSESWFINGTDGRQFGLRQLYIFTAAGNIPHGINWNSVGFISPKSYGTFTDGSNWYGVIYGSNTAIAGQVSFYVTSTNIVVLSGSGAPSIRSGIILLEWISNI